MNRSSTLLAVVATVIAAVSLAHVPAAAQTSRSPAVVSTASGGAGPAADAARTPWGDPDLQGIWTNATITSFERPDALADKRFLTDDEAVALEARTEHRRAEADRARGRFASYDRIWLDSGTQVLSTKQTSLVVDPTDGRVPVRPEAQATRDYNLAHNTDSYEHMSVWDRCITRGVLGSMFPAGYNNAYQILQTPEYVVIFYEMIHDARVIPLGGRSHIEPDIRLWMGDSRGRWDGRTLVVDTANFNDRGWIASSAAGGRMKGIPVSESLHVVERFTRVDTDTIQYDVTIEDPQVYTTPWTVAMPLTRNQSYQIFEYACHEGNTAVENILSGGRVEDAVTEAAATTRSRR